MNGRNHFEQIKQRFAWRWCVTANAASGSNPCGEDAAVTKRGHKNAQPCSINGFKSSLSLKVTWRRTTHKVRRTKQWRRRGGLIGWNKIAQTYLPTESYKRSAYHKGQAVTSTCRAHVIGLPCYVSAFWTVMANCCMKRCNRMKTSGKKSSLLLGRNNNCQTTGIHWWWCESVPGDATCCMLQAKTW